MDKQAGIISGSEDGWWLSRMENTSVYFDALS